MCIHVLKMTLRYLLIAEIIEMAQPAPMVNLPRSPLFEILRISNILGGHTSAFDTLDHPILLSRLQLLGLEISSSRGLLHIYLIVAVV